MTKGLKPCPFCGGEDFQIYKEGSVYAVKCGQCETKVGALDEKTAVEYWNNRPIEEAQAAEIKRLREALEIYKEALHEGLWKTGLQDSIWEIIEQAEEKAEQILKGGEE